MLKRSGCYPRDTDGPRPIELTVVVHEDVHPWRYPPRCEYLYGEWLRAEVESGTILAPFTSPDLAVVLAMVLGCRRAVFGPDPADLFGPIPSADLVRAGAAGLVDLQRNVDTDTTNVLLTLARIWHTSATGKITTKDAAGAWAAAHTNGAERHVLERAQAAYVRGEPHRWGPVEDDVRATAAFLATAIRNAAQAT